MTNKRSRDVDDAAVTPVVPIRFRWLAGLARDLFHLDFFSDPQVQILFVCATTQGSGPGRVNYQELEFLGDSVLGLLASCHAFQQCSGSGSMTDRRKAVVNNDNLARVGRRLRLPEMIDVTPGTVVNDSIVSDVVEAIFGAAFLAWEKDLSKLDGAFQRLLDLTVEGSTPTMVMPSATPATMGSAALPASVADNPIGWLHEHCQRTGTLPTIDCKRVGGEDHRPEFSCTIAVDGCLVGHATAGSRRQAIATAAAQARRVLPLMAPTAHVPPVHFCEHNAKNRLQEWCQRRRKLLPEYHSTPMGPGHAMRFRPDFVLVDGRRYDVSHLPASRNKKEAEMEAASVVLSMVLSESSHSDSD